MKQISIKPLGAPSCGSLCGPSICITALKASAACSGPATFIWMPSSLRTPGSPCSPSCPFEAWRAWVPSLPEPEKAKGGGTAAPVGNEAGGVWLFEFPVWLGPWPLALTFAWPKMSFKFILIECPGGGALISDDQPAKNSWPGELPGGNRLKGTPPLVNIGCGPWAWRACVFYKQDDGLAVNLDQRTK